jgi:hypothetical protein
LTSSKKGSIPLRTPDDERDKLPPRVFTYKRKRALLSFRRKRDLIFFFANLTLFVFSATVLIFKVQFSAVPAGQTPREAETPEKMSSPPAASLNTPLVSAESTPPPRDEAPAAPVVKKAPAEARPSAPTPASGPVRKPKSAAVPVPAYEPLTVIRGWRVVTDSNDGRTVAPVIVNGENTIRVNHEYGRGRWIQVENTGKMDLGRFKRLRFACKGGGEGNTLEIRITDTDGTVYGAFWDDVTKAGKWISIDIPLKELRLFSPGSDRNLDWRRIARISLSVSGTSEQRQASGKSEFLLAQMRFL